MTGLMLGACRGDKEPLGPTATVPQGTTTTNPYAVPPVIDEAYVNRVLAGLDQAVGDVVRLVVSTRTIPPEAVDRLRSLYVGEHRQFQLDLLSADVGRGLTNYREPPGNRRTTVMEVVAATSTCIFSKVSRDYSAVALETTGDFSIQWVVLIPAETGRSAYNPTSWTFLYDGFEPDGSAPENLCAK